MHNRDYVVVYKWLEFSEYFKMKQSLLSCLLLLSVNIGRFYKSLSFSGRHVAIIEYY